MLNIMSVPCQFKARNYAPLLEVPHILGSCKWSPSSGRPLLWQKLQCSPGGSSNSRWSKFHPQQCPEEPGRSGRQLWHQSCPRSSSANRNVQTCCPRTANECLVSSTETEASLDNATSAYLDSFKHVKIQLHVPSVDHGNQKKKLPLRHCVFPVQIGSHSKSARCSPIPPWRWCFAPPASMNSTGHPHTHRGQWLIAQDFGTVRRSFGVSAKLQLLQLLRLLPAPACKAEWLPHNPSMGFEGVSNPPENPQVAVGFPSHPWHSIWPEMLGSRPADYAWPEHSLQQRAAQKAPLPQPSRHIWQLMSNLWSHHPSASTWKMFVQRSGEFHQKSTPGASQRGGHFLRPAACRDFWKIGMAGGNSRLRGNQPLSQQGEEKHGCAARCGNPWTA